MERLAASVGIAGALPLLKSEVRGNIIDLYLEKRAGLLSPRFALRQAEEFAFRELHPF